jgi:hypothetical protein
MVAILKNKLFLFWETAQWLQRTVRHIQKQLKQFCSISSLFTPRPHNWAAELSDMSRWKADADYRQPGTFSSTASPRISVAGIRVDGGCHNSNCCFLVSAATL